MKAYIFTIICLLITSCSSQLSKISQTTTDNLFKFAQANCLFWYFSQEGYDTTDIRKIAGGFTEQGSSDPEKYQKIAIYLNEHAGLINSKQNIDPKLNLCLNLEKDTELVNLIK